MMKGIPEIKMTAELSIKTIHYLREKENMSLKDIASLLGTSPAYLQQVLNKKKVLQTRHMEKLQKKKPDIYLFILPMIFGEKFGEGYDFLKQKAEELQKKSQKGMNAVKSVTGDMAFAICKLITKDKN
ncbi:MAG: helix-turn-helix transcriptional regulator [Sedimentisphaerales bacterium]|nr:helix-turn-helix transcriptional regulator [Sedimentisphaerales bacterium]